MALKVVATVMAYVGLAMFVFAVGLVVFCLCHDAYLSFKQWRSRGGK